MFSRRREGKPGSARRREHAAAAPEEDQEEDVEGNDQGSFTVESLFDYINESAASLAKVVAAQKEKLQGTHDAGKAGAPPRKLSVRTSIKNKKGQHVRFVSEVEVYPLPESEGKDAWLSRRGEWGAAPHHDEVWDGKEESFRSKELNTKEFKTWLQKERSSNYKSFQELVAPLFRGKRSESVERDGGEEREEEFEVQIELVEAPENQAADNQPEQPEPEPEERNKRSGSKKRESKSRKEKGRGREFSPTRLLPRAHSTKAKGSAAPIARADDIDGIYDKSMNSLMQKKFEYSAPVKVGGRSDDVLLQQNILEKKLSKSQAAAAAAAGRVLMLKNNHGRTFGAAVKRKISLKPEPDMRTPASAGFRFPQLGHKSKSHDKTKKKKKKKMHDVRTRDTGLHMRPHFIVIFFLIPLLLIGIDDMWPYLEHVVYVLRNRDKDIPYKPDGSVRIPFWVRLIWPEITKQKWLKNSVRLGSYVLETGGLLFVLQQVYDWIILFRVVRTKIRVRLKAGSDSEYSQSEYSEYSDHPSLVNKGYTFLFKWQQPRPIHDIYDSGSDDDDDDGSDNDSVPSL